jgi:hypothetical protein
MHGIDKGGSGTHEQNPANRSAEDGNKSLIHMGNMFCGNEQIAQKDYNNYSNRHLCIIIKIEDAYDSATNLLKKNKNHKPYTKLFKQKP